LRYTGLTPEFEETMKVVQLQTVPNTLFQTGGLYALCDDGSIHYLVMKGKPKWRQLPSPQDQINIYGAQAPRAE
jgi:hypothetical protein